MSLHLKPKTLFQLKQTLKYCTAAPLSLKSIVKPPKASLKLVTPRLCREHIESLKNVSGLHLGSTGISWALLNIENERRFQLLEWNHFPFPTNTQKLHIYDICKLIFEVQHNLPETDLYVIESLSALNRSITNPIQQGFLELISQLQSMLCVALSHPDSGDIDQPKLVFLKNRLTARVFHLLMKSECITSRHIIENIIASQLLSDTEYYEEKRTSTNENSEELRIRSAASETRSLAKIASSETHERDSIDKRHFLNFHTRVVMDERLVSVYDSSKGYTSESLALALLNGICFVDLIVRPRATVLKQLQLPGT